MYYTVDGKIQERLSLDDYDGCTYLYPHESPSCSGIPYINPGKNGTSSSGGKSNHHMLFSFLLGILLSMGIFVLLKKTDLTKRLPW